ncbi:MAG: DUF3048 domain-containing protein [Oscillospiraceae bacterium]|nr:DUF3048 domain-containing protein [Oscillospiraceae bacterium]
MKKNTLRIISLFIALTMCILSFASCSSKDNDVTNADSQINKQDSGQKDETPVLTAKNPLTGESGYDEHLLDERPVAVMVENTPSARPQWGLCSPDIIVETEVEGGITRMMWLYANEDRVADKVGPVRSARNAYVELAGGLDAVFFHIGASDLAYKILRKGVVDDIDGMAVNFYSRDKSRNVAVEHTAYTTKTAVAKAIEEHISNTKLGDSYKNPLSFVESGATASGSACSSIKAVFSDDYRHTFEYNSSDSLYYNWMNSKEMTDENGKQMAVKNVIVLYADMVDLGDEKGHVDVDLSSGDGYYASEGKVISVKWSKGNLSDKLKITDENGNDISLNTGKSWIGFVRSSNSSKTVISE